MKSQCRFLGPAQHPRESPHSSLAVSPFRSFSPGSESRDHAPPKNEPSPRLLPCILRSVSPSFSANEPFPSPRFECDDHEEPSPRSPRFRPAAASKPGFIRETPSESEWCASSPRRGSSEGVREAPRRCSGPPETAAEPFVEYRLPPPHSDRSRGPSVCLRLLLSFPRTSFAQRSGGRNVVDIRRSYHSAPCRLVRRRHRSFGHHAYGGRQDRRGYRCTVRPR